MTATQLTPYLLDSSLIEYATAVTSKALRSSPATQLQTKQRAAYALKFFLGILDPSLEEENKQLDTFQSYYTALTDPELAEKVVQDLPSPTENSIKKSGLLEAFDLTPAQQVLSLPDTLDTIFNQIPLLTQSDRDTFYHATLTSHAFHNAAQLHLWRRPRDLDTVEQQVRFAFGTAISGSAGDSLGLYVKRLRIRIVKGGWNARLVEKIAALVPGVVDLTLHWGDSEDSEEPVTPSSVASLHRILESLPNLKHLYLAKFTYTPETENLQIPPDAYIPFTKLESLRMYDFHWYWSPISRGLGFALKVLDIGYGTAISGDKIVELCEKLTSLTTLRIASGLEVRHVRTIVKNLSKLEHVEITTYTEVDDEYVAATIPALAGLESLKELSFNGAIGPTQVQVLVDSPGPLEEISLKLKVDNEVADVLEKLFKAKRETLKGVTIDFNGDSLVPSDNLVEALASIPRLERISIDFQPVHKLSSSSVNELLKSCSKLEWTSSLEDLVAGNSLYEEEYKARLVRERDEKAKAMEEDVLGN